MSTVPHKGVAYTSILRVQAAQCSKKARQSKEEKTLFAKATIIDACLLSPKVFSINIIVIDNPMMTQFKQIKMIFLCLTAFEYIFRGGRTGGGALFYQLVHKSSPAPHTFSRVHLCSASPLFHTFCYP